jgi:hypothetical protein
LFENAEHIHIQRLIQKLTNHYKIPEGHFYLKDVSIAGQLFSNKRAYLSRYGFYLVTKELLHKSESFRNDLTAGNSQENRRDFEVEMKIAFARYYFAFQNVEFEDLVNTTWDYVRGDKLKSKYETNRSKLDTIVKGLKGRNADYRDAEMFRHKYIFDILFAHVVHSNDGFKSFISFQRLYESALRSFGYKFLNDKWMKFGAPLTIAPKSPGNRIAPHLMFFLIKHLCQFCDLVYNKENQEELHTWMHETFGTGRENKFTVSAPESLKENNIKSSENMAFQDLELLAMQYFFHLRIYLEKIGMPAASMFVDESYCDCYKQIKQAEFGSGRRKKDKRTGTVSREIPGVLENLSQYDLFCDDEKTCLNFRKRYEKEYMRLQEEYSITPTTALGMKINEINRDIQRENSGIYGFNLQEVLFREKIR